MPIIQQRAPKTTLLIILCILLASLQFPQRAAAQTTYFFEYFQDGVANGFTNVAGTWTIVDDGTGNKLYEQSSSGIGQGGRTVAGESAWTDYNLSVNITPTSIHAGGTMLIFRYVDDQNYYFIYMDSSTLSIKKKVNNVQTVLKQVPYTFNDNWHYVVEAEVRGDYIKAYVDHNMVAGVTDTSLATGKIGFGTWQASGRFDNVRVTETLKLGISRSNIYWYNKYFVDDFNDESSADWSVVSGNWSVVPDPDSDVDSDYILKQTNGSTGISARAIAGENTWSNYTFKSKVTPLNIGSGGVTLIFRYTDDNNYYFAYLDAAKVELKKKVNGIQSTLAWAPFTLSNDVEYRVEIDVYDSQFGVFIDDAAIVSATDTALTAGEVGLGTWQAQAEFDDVDIRNKQDQYHLLDEMYNNGMTRIRHNLSHSDNLRDIKDLVLYSNSIGQEVMLMVGLTGNPDYYPTSAVPRDGGSHWNDAYRLSDLDPVLFANEFASIMQYLYDAGCEVAIVGIGNEENWADFNGDFPVVPGGKIFNHTTPWNDPDYSNIRAGIDKWGQAIISARYVAENIFGVNQVQIVSGGVVKLQSSWVSANDGSVMDTDLFLQLLQGTHPNQSGATNYIDELDRIGLHIYPFVPFDASPSTGYISTKQVIADMMTPITDAIGTDKKFLVDEMGYKRNQVTEEERHQLYRWFMRALQDPDFKDIEWGTIYLYDFDVGECRIYHNGVLLPSGQIYDEYVY